MPYLIDGNNLLFAARDLDDPDRPPGRQHLCAALGAWARHTADSVCVVFDGPVPTVDFARQLAGLGVSVIFSGSGVSADSVLIDRIEADSAARRLVVVSTDRQIARAARRRRARAQRSDEFWRELKKALRRSGPPAAPEPPEKVAGLAPLESEQWLRELGLKPDGDPSSEKPPGA